jgi:hypothetical protein
MKQLQVHRGLNSRGIRSEHKINAHGILDLLGVVFLENVTNLQILLTIYIYINLIDI